MEVAQASLGELVFFTYPLPLGFFLLLFYLIRSWLAVAVERGLFPSLLALPSIYLSIHLIRFASLLPPTPPLTWLMLLGLWTSSSVLPFSRLDVTIYSPPPSSLFTLIPKFISNSLLYTPNPPFLGALKKKDCLWLLLLVSRVSYLVFISSFVASSLHHFLLWGVYPPYYYIYPDTRPPGWPSMDGGYVSSLLLTNMFIHFLSSFFLLLETSDIEPSNNGLFLFFSETLVSLSSFLSPPFLIRCMYICDCLWLSTFPGDGDSATRRSDPLSSPFPSSDLPFTLEIPCFSFVFFFLLYFGETILNKWMDVNVYMYIGILFSSIFLYSKPLLFFFLLCLISSVLVNIIITNFMTFTLSLSFDTSRSLYICLCPLHLRLSEWSFYVVSLLLIPLFLSVFTWSCYLTFDIYGTLLLLWVPIPLPNPACATSIWRLVITHSSVLTLSCPFSPNSIYSFLSLFLSFRIQIQVHWYIYVYMNVYLSYQPVQ